jgi:hypothetical protein
MTAPAIHHLEYSTLRLRPAATYRWDGFSEVVTAEYAGPFPAGTCGDSPEGSQGALACLIRGPQDARLQAILQFVVSLDLGAGIL